MGVQIMAVEGSNPLPQQSFNVGSHSHFRSFTPRWADCPSGLSRSLTSLDLITRAASCVRATESANLHGLKTLGASTLRVRAPRPRQHRLGLYAAVFCGGPTRTHREYLWLFPEPPWPEPW